MEDVTLAIFDLDGTIANSRPGILYSYRCTARDYGHPELTDEDFAEGLTGSLPLAIKKMLNLETEEEVRQAVLTYRDYYVEMGDAMCVPFEGFDDVFDRLRDRGLNLAVATMKVHDYALMTLDQWGMLNRFQSVHGADMKGVLTKADLIKMCLEDANVEPSEAVMIGDSKGDYQAAKANNVKFIGAVYGFNLNEAFCRREGVPFARSPKEIADIILGESE